MAAADAITISAWVYSRSSAGPGGPPGEAELLALNPDRLSGILRVTGWPRLEPGTLNLEAAREAVADLERLRSRDPVFAEVPEDVVYPEKWAHIPGVRGGYRYYAGTLIAAEGEEPILARVAQKPVLRGALEVFAENKLRDRLGLKDGDTVELRFPGAAAAEAGTPGYRTGAGHR